MAVIKTLAIIYSLCGITKFRITTITETVSIISILIENYLKK